MKLMMKGNRQLRVPEERVEGMLAQGWAETDAKTGRVLREPKQSEMEALKKENRALEKENKALKAELEALKAERTQQ